MEKTQVQYEELLKASHAQNFPSTLKVTSSSEGFRVMDPFDWTMDKNIYQRWQLWSHKARLALDAMEGDTETPRSPTYTIGSMVMALPRSRDGRAAKS